MRVVDPFAYWERHSSAIEGMGGIERSPDPRYLFHTGYHEVRAGHARFVLKLDGVKASFGELSARVHAWKPDGDGNVSLVSGARTLLHGDATAITLPVHFASRKGVRYALYGYLSEDSDVHAQALEVAIDEPDEAGEQLPEPPRSVLALDLGAAETRPANALLHYGRADVDAPVSQSCTREQLAALALPATRQAGSGDDAAIARWSETLCVNALDTYGATAAGLEGLVVGTLSADRERHLARSASVTRLAGGLPPTRTSNHFFDFLLMPGGIAAHPTGAADTPPDASDRWAAVEDWLARLKIGGVAALGLRYRPEGDLVSSSGMLDAQVPTRNEIGQWVLRLIAGGYSVAPMAFAPIVELAVDRDGLAGFVLIVQRA